MAFVAVDARARRASRGVARRAVRRRRDARDARYPRATTGTSRRDGDVRATRRRRAWRSVERAFDEAFCAMLDDAREAAPVSLTSGMMRANRRFVRDAALARAVAEAMPATLGVEWVSADLRFIDYDGGLGRVHTIARRRRGRVPGARGDDERVDAAVPDDDAGGRRRDDGFFGNGRGRGFGGVFGAPEARVDRGVSARRGARRTVRGTGGENSASRRLSKDDGGNDVATRAARGGRRGWCNSRA